MSFPVTFSVGDTEVSLHLIFEALAFIIGFQYYLLLRKKQEDLIPTGHRISILIGATFGAFLFSRIVGAMENPQEWMLNANPTLYFFSSKTITGGLLGGLMFVEGTKKIIGEKRSSGDLFTFPLILAMMIGRIGCFFSGLTEQTYGTMTRWPWGIDLGDGIPRHPVSLYEIIYLAFVWVILVQLKRTQALKPGVVFKLFMVYYFVFRFLIEWIKPSYFYSFGLSTIQITALIVLLYYAKTIFNAVFQPSQLCINEGT